MMETGAVLGKTVIHTLWGYEAFYDSIDICVLIDMAEKHNYPSGILTIALQLHLAPRVLRVGTSYSQPVSDNIATTASCS